MKNSTISIKDELIARGGKEWTMGNIERVYIKSDLFNEIMETSYGDNNNKFFYDCKNNCLMRSYKEKKAEISKRY